MAATRSSRAHRFRSVGAALLTVALVAAACSSEGAEPTEVLDDASVAASGQKLDGVTLESTSIEEVDVIRFEGFDLDGDHSDLELQAIVEGLDPIDILLFGDEVGVFAIAPFHPITPGEGGPLTLRLSKGSEATQSFDIQLSAIPEAPGAWDDAIASLLGELESRADQLGLTLDDIASTPIADLDDNAASIKFVAGFLDDGTEDDIGSLPSRPGDELTAGQMALLDSLVAKLGLGQMNLPPLDLSSVTAMEAGSSAFAVSDSGVLFNAVRATNAQAQSCRKKVIPINNGEDLKRELAKGIEAQNALKDGFFSDKSDYVVSNTLMLTGVAAGAFAFTGVGAPAAGVVAGVSTAAGAMYATQRLALMADASNYPSSFTALDIDVSLPEFNEDFTKDGEVTKVDVTAASTGFNATDALAGLGAAVADGALGIGLGKAVTGRASDVLGGSLGMSEPLRQTGTGKALGAAGSDYLQFCGQQWTVPINSSKYVRAWATGGNLQVDESNLTHKPLEVGSDVLWIETRPDAFPGASAINSVPIEIKRLGVIAEPTVIKVKKAGELVAITATLENADTYDLKWTKEAGEWTADIKDDISDARVTTRQLITPTSTKDYPFTVTMTSRSDTGLREGATDERSATVRVEIRKLFVSPDPGGVLVNKTLQFTAQDNEGKPRDVTWEATGGQIDSSGLYTAGKTPGTYSVTATATDDANVTETVNVTVVDECLIGSWLLRSQDFFNQVSAAAGGGETTYLSGEHRLTMNADGTFVGVRDAWSSRTGTPEGSVVVIIDAENPGTWIATDTEIFIEETGGGSETVELYVEVGGKLVSVPGLGNEFSFTAEAYSTSATYTCDADVLTSTASGVTSTFDRID